MTIWLISDTHFDHTNCIIKFKEPDGSFMRGEFSAGPAGETGWSPEAATLRMNEHIVDMWNDVVRPQDHVYHLGDVGMTKHSLRYVRRLNGHKRLIPGNHDIFSTQDYLNAGFKEIRGTRVLSGVVLSHIPLHPDHIGRFVGNVHGHIHRKPTPPGPYLNVGVEVLGYRPITLEEAVKRIRQSGHDLCWPPTASAEDVVSHLTEHIEQLETE